MRKRSLAVFFILLGFTSFSQNNIEYYKSNPDSLLQVYRDANYLDSLYLLTHGSYVYFYKKKDYKSAIKYTLIEANLGRQFLGESKYKNCIYNLGRFHYYDKQYYKSLAYYKKAIDSFSVDRKTYQSYCEIGRNYYKLRDYYQSINYYEKGLSKPEILKKLSLYRQYINYTLALDKIETKHSLSKKALVLKKAEDLADSIGLPPSRRFSLNNSFAKYYKNDFVFNFEKASQYYQKNLKIALYKKDTSSLISTYNNFGGLLNKVNNDSALYYLKKGISLSKAKTQVLAKLHLNLAEYYSSTKQHLKAIKNTHYALESLPSIKIDSAFNAVIKTDKVLEDNNKDLIWNILTDKANYYLENYEATLDISQAKLALKNLIVADKLIDAIRFENSESRSKLVWQNHASETYMLGVKAAHILKQNEKAFYFMEKSKAVLLLENISENQVKKQANLPKSILDKELHFEKTINTLENQLNDSNDDSDSLSKQFYNNKLQYKKFIESLKEDYPEYYNYKIPIQVISLNEVQENLAKDDVIIEYILNEKDGYILVISKENSKLYEIEHTDALKLKIENYLTKISKPLAQQTDLDSFNSSSKELYKILLPFIKEDAFQDKKSITIVPDYLLQNIPFESLKTTTNNYLLNSHEINYAYSVSFLKHNESIKRKAQKTFIGFSPSTFSDSKLTALNNSEFEIVDASKRFSGVTYLNDLATKANFLAHSNDYKIIHLSTHADANDSIAPWIAFKHKKLYLNELYTTKTQAELVVLSACKSSLGDIKKGEGVFSLARGFFYSGANSVVSTLWNVNDKSTQEILSSFYSYLDQGKTKSAALRFAKLDYLNSHSHSEISPYYWSSLVLVGDNSKIETSSHYYIYLIVFVVFLALFFLLKKKKT